jgi:hypothetical protein
MVMSKEHLTESGMTEVGRLSKLINKNNSETNSTGASLAFFNKKKKAKD